MERAAVTPCSVYQHLLWGERKNQHRNSERSKMSAPKCNLQIRLMKPLKAQEHHGKLMAESKASKMLPCEYYEGSNYFNSLVFLKNAHRNFPEPKVVSFNFLVLFNPEPQSKKKCLTMVCIWKKQHIATFEKQQTENVWGTFNESIIKLFCWFMFSSIYRPAPIKH